MNAVHDTLRTKVGDVQMNHFCQLCGHYIMLPGLMSLGSVDNVSKHSCQVLFYEKAATSDMIRLGLELMRTTTECLHQQKSHYLSQTKHFETLGIIISETFGKDKSVFDIGRPSHLDGLACGLLWEIFCLKTLQTRIN